MGEPSDYFRAMAAFANRDGGYIIFGIKDRPHELVGLQGEALERFQSIDNAVWTTNLKECFSPEILWDKTTYDFEGCTYGLIYTYESINKPVICKRMQVNLERQLFIIDIIRRIRD